MANEANASLRNENRDCIDTLLDDFRLRHIEIDEEAKRATGPREATVAEINPEKIYVRAVLRGSW